MNEEIIIDITVSPKSSRSKIVIDDNNNLKVYLQSPPIDGKANAECISLFSKKLKIPKSNITIEKGERGRKKRLLIAGITYVELIEKLKL